LPDEGQKKLAAQGILTYITIRTLPYHLYADECGLLALAAPLTSSSLSKNKFLTDEKAFPSGKAFSVINYKLQIINVLRIKTWNL